jgi:CubicO group peptidase (beta-lactamase class C family)
MDGNILKQKLIERIHLRIADKYFPGAIVGVVYKNGERLVVPAGKFTYQTDSQSVTEYSIYDMASVTKSIPTACLLLKFIDDGLIDMEEPIIHYIPELSIRERANIRIKHLLHFTLDYSNPEYKTQGIKYKSAEEMEKFLFTSELKNPPGTSYFYTNAVGILMGLVLERFAKKSLDVLADEIFFTPLGMTNTSFHPKKLSSTDIVPSEIDPWRGREIRGEIHDESAWTLRMEKNKSVGSAGLFSTVPDLLHFMEMLLRGGEYNGRQYFSKAMVERMHTNQLSEIDEHHGLGWPMERPWMGALHSPIAFGRTGFTGTAVFCDPGFEVAIVILSNGVYPTRDRAVKENLRDAFRAEIIDIILEERVQ